ncbi:MULTISPECIES: lytic transglycosylase domain-containing protein [Thiomonas]|jgi:type IV secretion system protein VirB1|uniref:Lytic transglycosylase domain-containing protein n=1 Tax=Thiomonas arsenitoxydans (strain DSM 22701 / CIP 110005 / 3As) TaxID=426114 RepID=A0A8I1MZ66_THIA3|nr:MULTISPECIES: lytic transglycosylase domain-containing protein [Thiomonas]CQR44830.1 Lytic transglycosylase catalytic [Thiomonas sp. CB3]MBN8744662.1 lytic transglycosylase domain-containing protein [Thiomonas arsenitoxydans]ODU94742.1 MAG: lytic transglycosylase [Thiomonas sp. SCN 64-16]CDW92602.1 Lytic transglycosylase catalytic [Thiomonas sp. CB2]SCC91871.1 Lytic transglycosylase catalytic [Thiomonas sp. X19]
MSAIALMEQCAPQVAPVTLAAIVQQESGGNPLALHDNTSGKSYAPATVAEVARLARELIAQGHSVDIGLAQINSRNLPSLGLGVDQILDPCMNLSAAQTVLLEGWSRSGDLRSTLSAYNTGKLSSPVGMAYGEKVFGKAGVVVPAIPGGQIASWATVGAALPPVRPVVTWTPQASPLAPKGDGLAAKW